MRRRLLPGVLVLVAVPAMSTGPAAARCNEAAVPMSVCDARSFIKGVARERAGRGITFTRIRPCKRLSPRSFRCKVRFFAGDVSWRGGARVGFRNEFRSDDYYSFHLKRTNGYTGESRRVVWRCRRIATCSG